jgi:hypothetical protein
MMDLAFVDYNTGTNQSAKIQNENKKVSQHFSIINFFVKEQKKIKLNLAEKTDSDSLQFSKTFIHSLSFSFHFFTFFRARKII